MDVASPDPNSFATYTSSDQRTAMVFAAMAVGFGLLFALITTAQALSQGNKRWWLWGAIALVASFLGFALWRLVGACDDGSPEEMLPR